MASIPVSQGCTGLDEYEVMISARGSVHCGLTEFWHQPHCETRHKR